MTEGPRFESGTIPDGIVPLVGYREWSVRRDADGPPRLVSLFHPTSWPHDRPFAAVCLRPVTWPYRPVQQAHDGVPEASCQCGVYAFRRPGFESLNGPGGPKARGVVVGWGRYVLGSVGWRVELARLVALLDQPDEHELLDQVAHRYRVALVPHLDGVRFASTPSAA